MITGAAIAAMLAAEKARFAAANPRSAELAKEAARHWHRGVPFHWMLDWGTPFPLFVSHAQGAELWDVDGHRYDVSAWGTPAPCSAIRPPRWQRRWPGRRGAA